MADLRQIQIQVHINRELDPESMQIAAARTARDAIRRDASAAARIRTSFARHDGRPRRNGMAPQPQRWAAPNLNRAVRISTTPLSQQIPPHLQDSRMQDSATSLEANRADALARLEGRPTQPRHNPADAPQASPNASSAMTTVAAAAARKPATYSAAPSASKHLPPLPPSAMPRTAQRAGARNLH
jgi:hypothetical protein